MHKLFKLRQNSGTPALGDISYAYDNNGIRVGENNYAMIHEGRGEWYDYRNNINYVYVEAKVGGVWDGYETSSAFDAQNRRVYKSVHAINANKTATWFFYYDPRDRLTEVRYTPDISVPTTYSTFQLFWLEDRLVLYWQTDYPSTTTTKRYVGTDETGRPIDMMSWPASGDATRVWAINPRAWGFDTNAVGPTVYQPVLFAGQYSDAETVAYLDDGATIHRPPLALNGFRTYDPFTGGYLQPDPLVPETWSTYCYADSNPVGKSDPTGLTWDGGSEDNDGETIYVIDDPGLGVDPCTPHFENSWCEPLGDPATWPFTGDWGGHWGGGVPPVDPKDCGKDVQGRYCRSVNQLWKGCICDYCNTKCNDYLQTKTKWCLSNPSKCRTGPTIALVGQWVSECLNMVIADGGISLGDWALGYALTTCSRACDCPGWNDGSYSSAVE